MNLKNQLQLFIEENKELLENGEKLSIILNDAYLTIYNEYDSINNCFKIVTLVDPADMRLELNLDQLINI